MDLTQQQVDERYEELPETIKRIVSPRQFDWLSDAEKERLTRDLTEPEA